MKNEKVEHLGVEVKVPRERHERVRPKSKQIRNSRNCIVKNCSTITSSRVEEPLVQESFIT